MNTQLKALFLLLFIGVIGLICFNVNDELQAKSIILNYGLTCGKIDRHIIATTGYKAMAKRYGIEYNYLVEGKSIRNRYYENVFVNIPAEKPNVDIEYLVIYENNNPKNSFILLNYPINSNNDLEKYKRLFKIKIPDNAINQD